MENTNASQQREQLRKFTCADAWRDYRSAVYRHESHRDRCQQCALGMPCGSATELLEAEAVAFFEWGILQESNDTAN